MELLMHKMAGMILADHIQMGKFNGCAVDEAVIGPAYVGLKAVYRAALWTGHDTCKPA